MVKAFTLIELLIVVAIIAILAAIAVPNFLEAQTRSKVSRCRADMRTVVTALESYRVDNPKYAMMNDVAAPGIPNPTYPFNDISTGGDDHARVPSWLTTPISYMTSIPNDPFVLREALLGQTAQQLAVAQRYVYFNYEQFLATFPGNASFLNRQEDAGAWLMYGVGPDRDPFNYVNAVYINYDPTNGTISGGNIFRTQRNNELYVD
jgi:prepilin-type N-terminal cleavage/methylation domain-containing protein